MPTRHLPTELLEEIFSQLSSSKSALYNLSLSCRTFYLLCKPFLYSHITIVTRVQRERLKQVRKEDAKLVRKLIIKGKRRSAWSDRTDGTECTVGNKIIEDLFLGNLLLISVVEILHVAHLYEKANDQEDPESLKMLSASNLVELSIRDHGGGGDFWDRTLADFDVCPKLIRLGYYRVTSYRRDRDSNPDSRGVWTFGAGAFSCNVVPALLHSSFHGQLEVCSSTRVDDKTRGEGNLQICYFSNMSNPHPVVRMLVNSRHLHVFAGSYVQLFSAHGCQLIIEDIRQLKIETPAFLSLPFSRAALTSDALAILSLVGVLGVELHYVDEEEDDPISLIPRSFVKFVEKQKKLKEEKEEKEKEEAA
ncbi:hypothetical protein JCM3765_007156 [Sporobolomyces pararoseus]